MATRKSSPFQVSVRDVMSERLETVKRDMSIDSLLRLFIEKNRSRVVVVDDGGKPLGVVSKTDLLMREAIGDVKTVMNVMSPGVVSVKETAPLTEAAALMARRELHGLVVTDGGLYGWLSASDVVRWVAEHAPH